MAGYDDLNPPAIVKTAEESINSLTEKIIAGFHLHQRHGRDFVVEGQKLGAWLKRMKGMMPGKFKEWVSSKMPFTYRYALRLIQLDGEATADRENPDDRLQSARLERNLKILCDDEPEQEVTSNPAVPFQPPVSAPPVPQIPPPGVHERNLREPGDETEYDDLAAKIQAILCPNCKRKGLSCDPCRGKVARLRAGEDVKPAAPKPGVVTRPQDNPTSNLKNGQVIMDWPEFHGHITGALTCIQRVYTSVQREFTPEKEGYDRRIRELVADFKRDYEKLTKQKAPPIAPGSEL